MKKILLLCIVFLMCSCNPKMHIVGAGMRYHNLSQNKYQPKKERRKVNLGTSPVSPFWFILGRF
jgi:hypothetical protein